jgi:hypothetical protein
MISPEKLTAGWLLDGVQLAAAGLGGPTGFEFRGILLEPGLDSIPQLGRLFSAPPHCLALEAALRDALCHVSLYRYERTYSERIMLSLVRLLDYFGSPQAILYLVIKLERGEFRGAGRDLIDRVAQVGARQSPRLRARFEGALRAPDAGLWAPYLLVPFLRTEIEEDPERWMSAAASRNFDLAELSKGGTNALALVLGALCESGRDEIVLKALASGNASDESDVIVLDLLFSKAKPQATLEIIYPETARQYRDREYPVRIIFDFFAKEFTMNAFLSFASPNWQDEPGSWVASQDRVTVLDDWGEEILKRSKTTTIEKRKVA